MIKTGHKSPQATRNRIKQKKIKIASERKLKSKPGLELTINFKQAIRALEKIKEVWESFVRWVGDFGLKPPVNKLLTSLEGADNTRPNKYLIGWGRKNE